MSSRAQSAACPECGADTWWAAEHADRIRKCPNGHYWTYCLRTNDDTLWLATIDPDAIVEVDGVPYIRTGINFPPPPPAMQPSPAVRIESHL